MEDTQRKSPVECMEDAHTQDLENEISLDTEGMRPFNVRRIQHTHRTRRMGADITQRTQEER